ncbi:hypothetical protein GQ54DRAFT_318944 [Martensiomyces pterosporus]|nr:hypothetical protein GQ54DRAFT_318944 [Martensiomyces pterosporus]
MDNSVRGKMQPYMSAIKLISAMAGLVVVGVGGFYLALNHYLDTNWPAAPEITRKETRKLLRGAAMREHVAPNPQIAYMFLLHALQQIYADGELDEESPVVQEIIVRLARAAAKMGEKAPAEQMLSDAWAKVVDGQGVPVAGPVVIKSKDQGGVIKYKEEWRDEQIGRIAEVLGPLQIERSDHQAGLRTYGAALQAVKRVENRTAENAVAEVDQLHLKQANIVTSLGETFALTGDCKTAKTLLESVLVDIRKRNESRERRGVDEWTCLDAIVMLDLAQVSERMGEVDDSAAWANSGLAVTREGKGIRACDNCQSHLVYHFGMLAEKKGDLKAALEFYGKALDHSRKTSTGNIEQTKAAIERIETEMLSAE